MPRGAPKCTCDLHLRCVDDGLMLHGSRTRDAPPDNTMLYSLGLSYARERTVLRGVLLYLEHCLICFVSILVLVK